MNTLQLPYPISANRYWKIFRGMAVKSREAKVFCSAVSGIAMKEQVSKLTGDVAVHVLLHPKLTKDGKASRQRIDLDNALKVAIDSLQGLMYDNDSQITKITAEIGFPITDGGMTISVNNREGEAKQ